MSKAYYRFIKFEFGAQGFRDISTPLTDWQPLETFTNDKLDKFEPIQRGWDEIRIETKIEEK